MKRLLLRLCVTAALGTAALAFASGAFAQNYIILFKQDSVASDAAATIKQAGGSVIATYPQIGVAIARSGSPSFAAAVLKDPRIDSAASTRGSASSSVTRFPRQATRRQALWRTRPRATRTTCRRSNGTWPRSIRRKPMRSRAEAARSWSATSTAASISSIRTSRRTTTRRTAPTARAAPRRPFHLETTSWDTARTPREPSRLRRTASGSSGSLPTCASPPSRRSALTSSSTQR